MKVRDVMTSTVVTVNPDTPFPELVDQLLRHGVSGLPVVDDVGHLVGIVTEPISSARRLTAANAGGYSSCWPTSSREARPAGPSRAGAGLPDRS